MKQDRRRTVTVLSGFLGSGKTTLLRRYLAGHGGDGIAVIINELGAVGVDHHLVRMVEEQPVLLRGGCVCCTRRDDLVQTLRALLNQEQSDALPPLRQVVIETSGIADPVPVLFTLATDPVLKHHFAPASVVVTLDALNAAAQIESQPELRKQIIAADRLVITKADLAGREAITGAQGLVRQLNPAAIITVSRQGDGIEALAPSKGSGAGLLHRDAAAAPAAPHAEIRSMAMGFSAPLDWPSFSVWLGMLLEARGPDMLRIKGLLEIGDAGPVVMNAAQHVVYPPEHLPAWPDGAQGTSERSHLVFITRGIDPPRIARSLTRFQHAGGRPGLSVRELS